MSFRINSLFHLMSPLQINVNCTRERSISVYRGLVITEMEEWQAAVQQAESILGGVRFTTAFLHNIPISLSDDLLEPLLRACGPLRRWKRPLAANGLPKPFGFAEYCAAHGLLRCQRLLGGLPLSADMRTTVKVDEETVEYLSKYEAELKKQLGVIREFYRWGDERAAEELIGIMQRNYMHLAKEFMEGMLLRIRSDTYLLEEDKENTSSSSAASSGKKVIIRRKSTIRGTIDWTGFEEREQRYLKKEALRLEKHQRQQRMNELDELYKTEKVKLFKRILSEYKN